nr:MAG TPA: hypothetical protein [Caudoviricetes sp.]
MAPSKSECHSTAPLRLCHGIHQMLKEMCRYFENHEIKLSTK